MRFHAEGFNRTVLRGRRRCSAGCLLRIAIATLILGASQGAGGGELSGEPAARPALQLIPVTSGELEEPLYLTHAGDGTGSLFVVEQTGRIRVLLRAGDKPPLLHRRPFLDLTDRVLSGGERGLLGLASIRNTKRTADFSSTTLASRTGRRSSRNGLGHRTIPWSHRRTKLS